MEWDNILGFVAVASIIVAVFSFGISLYNFSGGFTGYATSVGQANLTVESSASINFTTSLINWGSGRVNSGLQNATLNTAGGASNVTGGNWTGNTAGLVLENIGNVNISLDLASSNVASGFIGGTSPLYRWNITNLESESCNVTEVPLNLFHNVNLSADSTTICNPLMYVDTNDTIRIDIYLVIPSDSLTGARTSVITATAMAI